MTNVTPLKALTDKITIVETDEALTSLLEKLMLIAAQRAVRVAFVNAHAVNLSYRDPAFLDNLLACDYLFRDGSGMGILYRRLKRSGGLNLNGTDLIPRIIKLYRGKKIALMGTAEPYLGNAARAIATEGVTVAFTMDGFQADNASAQSLANSPVDMIILAMGMPKQERVAALLAEGGQSSLILCGGAILDFLGGKVSRAPLWIRTAGLEWFYRLAIEPKRMFKRYVIGNFVFLARVLRHAGPGN